MTERVDATAEAIPVSTAVDATRDVVQPVEDPDIEKTGSESQVVAATPDTSGEPSAKPETEIETSPEAEPSAEVLASETAPAQAEADAAGDNEPETSDVGDASHVSDESLAAAMNEELAAKATAKADSKPDSKAGTKAKTISTPPPETPEVAVLRAALNDKTPVDGKVFGWNEHGFHVSLVDGKIAAFCPRSEMEVKQAREGSTYLDQTFAFRVLKVQRGGKRVVVSRAEVLRGEMVNEVEKLRADLEVGKTFEGTVTSLTDFGAFVDIGGIEGLVHVSEIGHQRVNTPSEVLQLGQTVQVQIIKIEKGGKRLSLSMKALEADPWADVRARFPEGTKVKGKVERTEKFGVIIELEPGLSGLLPASEITLPPGSSFVRVYPTGREVEVLVGDIDSRRRRISLMLEGSRLEGSRNDFVDYKKRQSDSSSLGSMADALARLGLAAGKGE